MSSCTGRNKKRVWGGKSPVQASVGSRSGGTCSLPSASQHPFSLSGCLLLIPDPNTTGWRENRRETASSRVDPRISQRRSPLLGQHHATKHEAFFLPADREHTEEAVCLWERAGAELSLLAGLSLLLVISSSSQCYYYFFLNCCYFPLLCITFATAMITVSFLDPDLLLGRSHRRFPINRAVIQVLA